MKRINTAFAKLCNENPQQRYDVVITMAEEVPRDIHDTVLGFVKYIEIGLGIYKARLDGDQIIALGKRNEIEEICQDFDIDLES